ncbi:DUF2470 domain-containing protein [Streptomyces sp. NBC_00525]|uniref:DUF2470 domain-containing protein n=1 Tax=Streptomyces sp. NBC_00525 TaxID=2903660 RepID=UPI002E81FC41|nr:DUF2470 domain-containing protein [Streptomyces sp. NBC_00525]WUC92729.1 DUF2470 domain-containing protein [Streptomyces sp. NBC_00525]
MPSAAERTRTLVQSTCSAVLLVPGLESAGSDQLMPLSRGVGPDGDLFLEFPEVSPVVRAAAHAQDDELPAVLEITDVAPVSVPHRVRGRARIAGRLTAVPGMAGPGRMLLRLETGEAYVDDLWGTESVTAEDFRDASPDPLAAHEADLLQHLHAAHPEELAALSGLLGSRASCTCAAHRPAVVPLALDRLGLRVRVVERDGGCFDARFEFPEPVRDVTGLSHAMHTLFAAAAR